MCGWFIWHCIISSRNEVISCTLIWETVKMCIRDRVMSCQSIGIAKKVKSLFDTLKLMAYSEPLPIETDRIHVANGTYFLNGTFTEDKTYCNNRMKVKYNPSAPQPQRWLRFLSDLLVLEDIPTLQEYLGYCLIPSTKGQKMLMLIGKGLSLIHI